MLQDKKMIVWGTGDKSKLFTQHLWKMQPEFYVDNNEDKNNTILYGKRVVLPSCVECWEEYLVVVAIKEYESVYKQLEQYGLKHGIDFMHFTEVLRSNEYVEKMISTDIENALHDIENRAEILQNRILIWGAMLAFDSNSIANLNEVNKSEHIIVFSEASKERIMTNVTNEDIIFDYYELPFILLKNHYLKQRQNTLLNRNFQCEYIAQKDYLNDARKVLRKKYWSMEYGYENYMIYYYDYFIRRVMDILKPKCVVMWNQFYPLHAVLDYVCHEMGVKVVYIEYGSLPGTYAIDYRGQMGESIVSVESEWFKALTVEEEELEYAEKVWRYLFTSRLNRKIQPENDWISEINRKIRQDRPIIFYAGQNDYESGLYPYTERTKEFHSPVFKSSMDALVFLAEKARENNWNLIYKPHPVCMEERISVPNNVILIKEGDINDIINFADVTVTILSQVGYISTIRKKPTVMLGYTQLKGKECTYEAFERDKIMSIIKEALIDGFTSAQERNFLRHIAQLVKYYLYDDNSTKEISFGKQFNELWRCKNNSVLK
ncbi:MAG: hypothetical protein IKK33_04120 [Lachnospiraceae bacterium]|nr:hypothetical protein [Lachnospiraceae bacterium]